MRGQATPIQHLHQRGKSPNNKNASDKLPSYLQSLHQFRPTKPSHGFSETGLGRLKPNGFKTPGSFQTYLLFTMYPKQAPSSHSMKVQTFIFSRRQFALTRRRRSVRAPNDWRRPSGLYCCHTRPWIRSPIQDDSPSRLVARPVRSLVRRQDKTNGGAERDRTADPLLAKQVLSQLSYSPIQLDHPSLSTRRGNNSHQPTVSTQTLIRISKWWAREDLNFRPHAYQACALTN